MGKETVDRDHQFAGSHEPGGMLLSVLVDEIGPEKTFFDKIDPSCCFPGTQQRCSVGELFGKGLLGYPLLEWGGQGRDVAKDL